MSGWTGQPLESPAQTVELFARHVHPGKVKLFAELGVDLLIGAREGPRFQDAISGRWFVNCHANGGVFNLGHRHPDVIAAVRAALDTIDIGNHHLVSGWRAVAAQKLAATTDGALPGVVFTASGSEAVEATLKIARGHSGRQTIVAVHGAYHGVTSLAVAVSGDEPTRRRYGADPPEVHHVPHNDADAMAAAVDETTAAVILESIPATLGFPPPAPGYLAAVAARCREVGALLILDEVQTGLGRTGTIWYAQQEGVVPDALITGKGLSGGIYPVSAALLREDLFEWFTEEFGSHPSSFGGAELGCVAAATVCDLITGPGFLDHVRALAAVFTEGFADAPFGVRQRGLTMGLETGVEGGAFAAWKALFEVGVFAFPAAYDTSVVQFKPPLILQLDEAHDLVERVTGALAHLPA